MAAKRVPSGMTWEQHQKAASDLKMLNALIFRRFEERKGGRPIQRLYNLLDKIKHEMDELVFIDCMDKPKNDRLEVYYMWRELPDASGHTFRQVRSSLADMLDLVVKKNPKGGAVKHLNAMLECIDKAAL